MESKCIFICSFTCHLSLTAVTSALHVTLYTQALMVHLDWCVFPNKMGLACMFSLCWVFQLVARYRFNKSHRKMLRAAGRLQTLTRARCEAARVPEEKRRQTCQVWQMSFGLQVCEPRLGYCGLFAKVWRESYIKTARCVKSLAVIFLFQRNRMRVQLLSCSPSHLAAH